MADIRGRLELKSNPPGARVFLDGHFVGVTKSDDPAAEMSDILAVDSVAEGEHTVIFRLDGYSESVQHPRVESLKTVKAVGRLRRIFKPDGEVVTSTGTYRGVMVENRAEMIVIETKPGVNRTFMKSDVKKVKTLID